MPTRSVHQNKKFDLPGVGSGPVIKVSLDATPLLARPTGVGHFAERLIANLASQSAIEPSAYAISVRGFARMGARLPRGVRHRAIPFPPSVLMKRWANHGGHTFDRVFDRLIGDVDVVHGTNFFVPPTRHPSVVTVHDLTCVKMPHLCSGSTLLYPELINRAVRGGSFFHTPTQAVADELVSEFSIPVERVAPIHLGFDANVVQAGSSSSRQAGHGVAPWGDEYIATVGTVEPRKNFPHLIEAFSVLARRRKNLHLVIVGQRGWGIERTEAAITASGCADRIHLTGWVSDERRRAIVANARAFAFVSLYEGFGLPPLEAMALRVPVVVSTVAALAEVCGGAAISVSPTAVAHICDALDSVIDDSAQRRRMVEEGLSRIGHFTWERSTHEMTALYSSALAQSK